MGRKFRLFLILSSVILSGCMNEYFNKVDNFLRVNEKTSIEFQDIPVPARGEQVNIYDPATDREKTVIFGDAYTAASGRKCSLYYSPDMTGMDQAEGIACSDMKGNWMDIPFIGNSTGNTN